MALNCTAINLSDELQCEEEAKSLNRLFCHFHSKQCQGQWGTTPTPASRANNFEQAFVEVINLVTPSSTPLQNLAHHKAIAPFLSCKPNIRGRQVRGNTS